MIKSFLIIAVCIIRVPILESQTNKQMDSLLTLLKKDKEDTNKVNHLNNLCDKFRKTVNYDTALILGKQSIALAQKTGSDLIVRISNT